MMSATYSGNDAMSLGDKLRMDAEEYNEYINRKFQPGIDLYKTLIDLKNNNEAYGRVVEKLIRDTYSSFPDNGMFCDGYSSEYELGYHRGLSTFLFPEAELHRYEERKENEKKEVR